MKVYLERTNEYKDVQAASVKEVLAQLKINPTTVLVAKNGQLVTEGASVQDSDTIKIISVISGG